MMRHWVQALVFRKKHLFGGAILLMAGFAGTSVGQAADPAWKVKLETYLTSPSYNAMISDMALRNERALSTGCLTSTVEKRSNLQILQEPRFAGTQEAPVAGSWKDQVEINRCGRKAYHNFLFVAQPDKQPELVVLMPGTTRTNPVLQRDVLVYVGGQAKLLADQKCFGFELPRILNTAFEKENKPLKSDGTGKMTQGEWQEIWSYDVCGQKEDFRVLLRVKPDGTSEFISGYIKK